MLDYPVLLIFPLAMAYAAVMDIFTMTIPNRVSLALIVGFYCVALLSGMAWLDMLKHTGVALAVLVFTIGLFSQGWLGGGDAKLLPAAALWFGYTQVLDYLILVALFGGVLSLMLLSFRNLVPSVLVTGREWAERLHDKKSGIPYGVALAAAGLWLYPKSDIFQAFFA
ncbi:MAG: prepilin peptidase [Hyphomicrobiaceae bacterium]